MASSPRDFTIQQIDKLVHLSGDRRKRMLAIGYLTLIILGFNLCKTQARDLTYVDIGDSPAPIELRVSSSEGKQQHDLNVTQLLITRFHYLFKNIKVSEQKLNSEILDIAIKGDGQEPQSTLENRKIDDYNQRQSLRSVELESQVSKRNLIRIYDKVFSRSSLPEVFRSSRDKLGSHCSPIIGCIEELPNYPAILKKSNVSSTFTIYTPDNPKFGRKILYEPLMHYQLQDMESNLGQLEDKIRGSFHLNHLANQLMMINAKVGQNSRQQPVSSAAAVAAAVAAITKPRVNQLSASSWRSAANIIHSQEYPFDLSALEQSKFNSSLNTRIIIGGYFAKEDEEWIDEVVRQWTILEPQSNVIKVSWAEANRGLYHSAAYNSRIVGRQLTLFLHYLDQMFNINLDKFHLVGHSLGAHIAGFVGADNNGKIARITGLDPAGPIFVELNTSMRLDPTDAKFVDVMHTNGGTITKGSLGLSTPSGHVDYYCNGGSIQPGCYFSSVSKSIMDPVERIACNHRRSYRYFIEITKMTIRANEEQREASNIRPIDEQNSPTNKSDICSYDTSSLTYSNSPSIESRHYRSLSASPLNHLPSAFLFESKAEDLVRLVQPEILVMRHDQELEPLAPAVRKVEFHLLKPEFPIDRKGTYIFRTRSESPFFASKQYALTLRTDSVIRRKIAIAAKINQTLVAEAELDEIPGLYSLIFAPNDRRLVDSEGPPQLQLMWRYRSFNLLLNQQNELHLSGLELSPLEPDGRCSLQPSAIVRYSTSQEGQTTATQIPATSSSLSATSSQVSSLALSGGTLLKGSFSGHLALIRNQWHKFEGKQIKVSASSVS